jgi:hypothetical protein
LESPLLALFTLPCFVVGYPRPRHGHPELCVDGIANSKGMEGAFYSLLAPSLLENLAPLWRQRSLSPRLGSMLLVRSHERLTCLVRILAAGFGWVQVEVRGLEMQEPTICHHVEAGRIDDTMSMALDGVTKPSANRGHGDPGRGGQRHPGMEGSEWDQEVGVENPPEIFVMQPVCKVASLTYEQTHLSMTGILDNPDTLRQVHRLFLKTLVWVMAQRIGEGQALPDSWLSCPLKARDIQALLNRLRTSDGWMPHVVDVFPGCEAHPGHPQTTDADRKEPTTTTCLTRTTSGSVVEKRPETPPRAPWEPTTTKCLPRNLSGSSSALRPETPPALRPETPPFAPAWDRQMEPPAPSRPPGRSEAVPGSEPASPTRLAASWAASSELNLKNIRNAVEGGGASWDLPGSRDKMPWDRPPSWDEPSSRPTSQGSNTSNAAMVAKQGRPWSQSSNTGLSGLGPCKPPQRRPDPALSSGSTLYRGTPSPPLLLKGRTGDGMGRPSLDSEESAADDLDKLMSMVLDIHPAKAASHSWDSSAKQRNPSSAAETCAKPQRTPLPLVFNRGDSSQLAEGEGRSLSAVYAGMDLPPSPMDKPPPRRNQNAVPATASDSPAIVEVDQVRKQSAPPAARMRPSTV